jgi:Ni/Co efflux regulator RcnB
MKYRLISITLMGACAVSTAVAAEASALDKILEAGRDYGEHRAREERRERREDEARERRRQRRHDSPNHRQHDKDKKSEHGKRRS